MAPALVVGSVQLIRAAVTKLSAFIKSAAFLKLSKTERAALRLQQKLNEEYLRVVDEIDAAKSLDELDEIKAGLNGKSDELSKGVFEKIEDKRVKLKQQKQLDELDESLKKQQQPEVKEPTTKKVEEEPAATEPKKEEPKSDLDDPGKSDNIGESSLEGKKTKSELEYKLEFLEKTGKELPADWEKFSREFDIEFAERLKKFRENDDLSFDPEFRGGEGQLFDTPLQEDLILKRWFSSRVKDMPESIRLLEEAKKLTDTVPGLKNVMEVVSTNEKGSDWILRGFHSESLPLKKALASPHAVQAKENAINLLSQEKGEIAKSILKKLNNNSANLHWAPTNKKIIIIDMQ